MQKTRVQFPAGEPQMLRVVLRVPVVLLSNIVVSIPVCHAEDPGSIPGRGATVCLCFIVLALQ